MKKGKKLSKSWKTSRRHLIGSNDLRIFFLWHPVDTLPQDLCLKTVSTAKSFIMEVQDLIKENSKPEHRKLRPSTALLRVWFKFNNNIKRNQTSATTQRFNKPSTIYIHTIHNSWKKISWNSFALFKVEECSISFQQNSCRREQNGHVVWENSEKFAEEHHSQSKRITVQLTNFGYPWPYGVHVIFVKNYEETYETKNIFFKLISSCLTGNR